MRDVFLLSTLCSKRPFLLCSSWAPVCHTGRRKSQWLTHNYEHIPVPSRALCHNNWLLAHRVHSCIHSFILFINQIRTSLPFQKWPYSMWPCPVYLLFCSQRFLMSATFQSAGQGNKVVDSAAGRHSSLTRVRRPPLQPWVVGSGAPVWTIQTTGKKRGCLRRLSFYNVHSHKSTCWPSGTPLAQTFHLSTTQDRSQGQCLDVGLVSNHPTECAFGNFPQSYTVLFDCGKLSGSQTASWRSLSSL